MTKPEREDVEFTSNGATLRGWLYPAAGAEPAGAVVMAHGLSAVKEMFLDDYAASFAAAGFTTLAFDNFGFGASDGEPRQSPAPDLLLQGYRDGVAWIARQPVGRREPDRALGIEPVGRHRDQPGRGDDRHRVRGRAGAELR